MNQRNRFDTVYLESLPSPVESTISPNRKRENHLRFIDDQSMIRLFSLDEDVEYPLERNQNEIVKEIIRKDNWKKVTPVEFHKSYRMSVHPLMLSSYTVEEYMPMRLFKMHNYNIGFALKEFEDKGKVELVSVFNNEPFIKNIGRVMIQNCIDHGARYLDHFDGFLTGLYSSMGFVEYKRDPYNPDYDPDGAFRKRYGPKDVIYRKLQ